MSVKDFILHVDHIDHNLSTMFSVLASKSIVAFARPRALPSSVPALIRNFNVTNVNKARKNYYEGLKADYSIPQKVNQATGDQLIADAWKYINMKDKNALPAIDSSYTQSTIESENKDWWPTHCEALRRGDSAILNAEYRDELVYFCQDGPFTTKQEQEEREKHWWALLAQPGVTMTWPIVMFWGEFVHFEWSCMDNVTHEITSKGTVCWVRRGHRGGCYFKSEQLTFFRDVYASDDLLQLVDANSAKDNSGAQQ